MITIAPPFQDVTITQADQEMPLELTVSNDTSHTQEITLSVIDFGQLNESGGVAFIGQQSSLLERKYGLAAWLNLPKQTVILEPGDTETITATIINKASLSPGGHYAGIIGRLETDLSSTSENNISVQPSFVSLVFAKKTGGEKYSLSFVSLEHNGSIVKLPNQVELRFNNTGNVHVVPRGTVHILGNDGSEIAKGIINQNSLPILPESFRIYSVELDDINPTIAPGLYRLEISYRYDGREEFTNHHESLLFSGWYPIAIFALIVLSLLVFLRFRHSANNK